MVVVFGTGKGISHLDAEMALHEVTFVVVDTETTGSSPATCALTEIAAAKFRGGTCLGTYQTLVDPGMTVPGFISSLTGITDEMVRAAPPVSAVLPSFLEFSAGSVLVGHNLRFDLSFLDTALVESGRAPMSNVTFDTLALARKLANDFSPDCRLATLAQALRLDHTPSHRALDDVFATADLLHRLIELAAGFGAGELGDLLELHRFAAHPQAAKLQLTADLPRRPGVYMFRDEFGALLFAGAASDLRSGARRHFEGSKRSAMLCQLGQVAHLGCTGALEAAVVEARLVQHHKPPFNRSGRGALRKALSGRARIGPIGPIRRSGRVLLEVPGEERALLHDGTLVECWDSEGTPGTASALVGPPCARELTAVASWVDDNARAGRLQIVGSSSSSGWPRAQMIAGAES